jgi:hypothetical protein
LREITNSQKRAFSSTKTKFGAKGVWITKSGNYVAEIKVARQKIYLGSFGTLQEARAAYAKLPKKHSGPSPEHNDGKLPLWDLSGQSNYAA